MMMRRIGEEDIQALVDLDSVCFEPGIAFGKDEFRGFLETGRCIGLAIAESSVLVAFLLVLQKDEEAEVITIDVSPSFRRRGLATGLLHRMEELLKEREARIVTLHVATDNRPALRFYRKESFVIHHRARGYYGRSHDAFFMKKLLL
jgi:ribosomal-protein-alanine N-acetyltransferase